MESTAEFAERMTNTANAARLTGVTVDEFAERCQRVREVLTEDLMVFLDRVSRDC